MKTLSTGFQAALEQSTTTLCTAWKVELTDGSTLGFTDHVQALTVDGVLFEPESAYDASNIETRGELSVANLEMFGLLDSEAITEADLIGGRYDNAAITVYLVDYSNPLNYDIMRRGWVGEVSVAQDSFSAEMRGLAQALQQPVGEQTSPTCRADLGDVRCGVSLATHTVTGSITSITDKSIFRDSARTEAEDFFAFGVLTWATGAANAGLQYEVKASATDGTFTLIEPARNTIATGDGYSVYRGCNKLATTCKNVFSNLDNQRAELFIAGVGELAKFGRQ